MNISPINFRYSYHIDKRLVIPAFESRSNGTEIPRNLEPESKYTRNKMRAETAAVMLMAGLGIATFPFNEYRIKSECNMVVSEQSRFDTRKEALEYAKKKVTNALKEPSPYEYCVIIDNNNNIVGEFKGDSTEVKSFYRLTDVIKNVFAGYNVTSVHGHPDGVENVTTPISFGDFRNLVNSLVEKESIVLNKQGEYSILKKTDKFVPLKENKIEALYYIYQKIMIDAFDENYPDKFLQSDEYNAAVTQFSQTMKGIKIIDAFWRVCAPKVGLEYKTNYSYLRNVKNSEDNP